MPHFLRFCAIVLMTNIHFREISFRLLKIQWTPTPRIVPDAWFPATDVSNWWEWFFYKNSSSPFRKRFHNHSDCLSISLATLNASETENNSLSSCNFFLFSKLPLLAEEMWRNVRPGACLSAIKADYSDCRRRGGNLSRRGKTDL